MCHDGNTATGKTPDHFFTTLECNACHLTSAWLPATFDHAAETRTCNTCHNGIYATGKNSAHILSTETCDACHSNVSWVPTVRVDHNDVIGTCVSCHNDSIALGKILIMY